MQRKEYLDWISTNKLFWGTTICSCLVGMGEFTSLLEYYQPVFDTYGINEKNKWRLIFRLATIHFFIAVCPRLTGCRKIVELCLTALYVYSPKEGGKRAVFGWAGTAPTQCARMVWKWFSYNFLLESKTYILARWDFHLREPRNVGIRISQWDQSCAFIWLVRVWICLADLPPKLPPKGFGTGQHDAALFCTHGTKSVLSLGTQYHQTQQNSTVTHKF